jgi:hypothetical protein
VAPPTRQSSNPRFDTLMSHKGGIFFSVRRDVCGDFVNLKLVLQRSFLEVLIGVECTCVRS